MPIPMFLLPQRRRLRAASLKFMSASVFIDMLGAGLLAQVSNLPRDDWHAGTTFFICASLQACALLAA